MAPLVLCVGFGVSPQAKSEMLFIVWASKDASNRRGHSNDGGRVSALVIKGVWWSSEGEKEATSHASASLKSVSYFVK